MHRILPLLVVFIAIIGCSSGPSRAIIERDAEQEFMATDALEGASKIRVISIRNILYPAEGRLALADCYIQAEKTGDLKPDEERFYEKEVQVKYRKKRGEWIRCTDSEWEDILSEDPMLKFRKQ